MKKIIFLSIFALVVVSLFFFSAGRINAVDPSDYGLKEGDLISAIFSDDPDVYIINEHGYKRLFLNPEIFNFYGHLGGFFNVKLVTQEVRDSFITSCCRSTSPLVGFPLYSSKRSSGTISPFLFLGLAAISDG